MPFLHSGLLHSLLSNVPPFGLLGETSSLFCSLRMCPAQRVTFISAAVSAITHYLYIITDRPLVFLWLTTDLNVAAFTWRLSH
jgi:hypothetical protein